MDVEVGETAEFDCVATDASDVVWSSGGEPLKPPYEVDGGKLTIPVTRDVHESSHK